MKHGIWTRYFRVMHENSTSRSNQKLHNLFLQASATK